MINHKEQSIWFNIDPEKIKRRIDRITKRLEAILRQEELQKEIHNSYQQSSHKE